VKLTSKIQKFSVILSVECCENFVMFNVEAKVFLDYTKERPIQYSIKFDYVRGQKYIQKDESKLNRTTF
jgi:hypothetical protein